jgi:hypothetical protein
MSATSILSLTQEPPASQWLGLPGESAAISTLLDVAILQTRVEGAYVYRFDRDGAAALIAFVGPAPRMKTREVPREVTPIHWNRKTPVVLRSGAVNDWGFSGFPELQDGRFDGVVSVPLVDSGETVGLANFYLSVDQLLGGDSLSLLMNLSLPLGALLIAPTLKEQLQKVQEDLADRKVLERAKGILTSRFGYTEEEAYLRIRRASRRNRMPMRKIADLVIESGVDLLGEAFDQ